MAKTKGGTFLAKLKQQIAQSGQSKAGFWFVKAGERKRIRFLERSDLEDGITVPWHSKWEGQRNLIDSPCLTLYGKDCPFCGQDEVRLVERYAWTVYDYLTKERQIFLFAANRASPIPHLANSYESWGTICDRDVTIVRNGNGKDTTYSVVADAPSEFRVKGIKSIPESKLLQMVWKAFGQGDLDDYPDEGVDESDDDEYEDDESEDEETADDEDYEDADDDYDESEEDDDEEELPRKKSVKKAAPVAKKAAAKRR